MKSTSCYYQCEYYIPFLNENNNARNHILIYPGPDRSSKVSYIFGKDNSTCTIKKRRMLTFYHEVSNLSWAVYIPLLLGHNGAYIRVYG